MRTVAIILSILLTGCTTVPVVAKFPEAPSLLLTKCPELKTIPTKTTVFSELTKTVTENYSHYHICAARLAAWTEWYNAQKRIYESIE